MGGMGAGMRPGGMPGGRKLVIKAPKWKRPF